MRISVSNFNTFRKKNIPLKIVSFGISGSATGIHYENFLVYDMVIEVCSNLI